MLDVNDSPDGFVVTAHGSGCMSVRPKIFSFITNPVDTESPETPLSESPAGPVTGPLSALGIDPARVLGVVVWPPVVSGEPLGPISAPNAPMTMTKTIRAGTTIFPIPLYPLTFSTPGSPARETRGPTGLGRSSIALAALGPLAPPPLGTGAHTSEVRFREEERLLPRRGRPDVEGRRRRPRWTPESIGGGGQKKNRVPPPN